MATHCLGRGQGGISISLSCRRLHNSKTSHAVLAEVQDRQGWGEGERGWSTPAGGGWRGCGGFSKWEAVAIRDLGLRGVTQGHPIILMTVFQCLGELFAFSVSVYVCVVLCWTDDVGQHRCMCSINHKQWIGYYSTNKKALSARLLLCKV